MTTNNTPQQTAGKVVLVGAFALFALGLAAGTAHAFNPQPEPPVRPGVSVGFDPQPEPPAVRHRIDVTRIGD